MDASPSPPDPTQSAADHLDRGAAARRAGDREEAVACFRRGLEAAPTHRRLRLELATTLRELRRTAEAEPLFRALLAEEPELWQAHAGLGTCARLRRDLPASAEHLARAVAAAPPQERGVRLEYAGTLREQRRIDEAEAIYRAVLADDPGSWQAHTGLGICARQRRDLPTSAEHLALAAAAAPPQERGVRLEYAGTLREQRRIDEAEAIYRALLADDPGSWQAHTGLGICARLRHDFPASAEHLALAAAAAPPQERGVRLEYAGTLREQRRIDEAEAVYRALLADKPGSWHAHTGLGICARLRHDLPASADHLARAYAAAPHERGVCLEYAGTLREQRRTEEAEAVYRALLANDPGSWQAHTGLGICARLRHDRAAALACFAAATQAAPDEEGPWVELAHEHREAGRFDAARAILRGLIDRGLADARTFQALGLVERWADERAAALEVFRDGYARHPQWHQFLIEMAMEARALGRFPDAERWLLQAAKIAPLTALALFHLGDLARLMQDHEQALDLFRRSASLPGAPIAAPAAVAQCLADLGRLAEALDVLDDAERQAGAWPDLAQKRAHLLRRAGLRVEALAVVRQAAAAFPGHAPLWSEWFDNERFSGDPAALDRCLAAARPGTLHERAQIHLARGLAAEQSWELEQATAEFREAARLNPAHIGLHEVLARLSLLRFDIPAARGHLHDMRRLHASIKRQQNLSPHLAHTHLGHFFDEFVMDAPLLAKLVAAQGLAPDSRVDRILALLQAEPDHTPTAIGLLVALRQAGAFAAAARDTGASPVPATIIQYWDEATPPDDTASLMASWRACNPTYRYIRFDHESAREFLCDHYPQEVLTAYLRAREPAMKADIFRMAYLFAEGGCYADADDRCLRPLDDMLPSKAHFVAYQENFGTIGNNFLAVTPCHPVMEVGLRSAVAAVNRGDDDMLWLSTGPGLLTRTFARTLATSLLLPAAWVSLARIFAQHELEPFVAMHCAAAYKNSRRHWLRVVFGQPKPAARLLSS